MCLPRLKHFRGWGSVPEGAVRPKVIVGLSHAVDDRLNFPYRIEELPVGHFITQFAIEAFIVASLPGTPWFNKQGPYTDTSHPLADRFNGELRAVIGSDIFGRPALHIQFRQSVNHIIGPEMAGHLNRQTFTRVFDHDAQQAQRSTLLGPCRDKT